MKRTLGLTMIVKNEAHNLPRLFRSVHGVFDEIYVTDTGSADGTIEYLISDRAYIDSGCHVKLYQFDWCDDFSKARNYNLKEITTDYWMWLDGDDVIKNIEAFKAWKSSAMPLADAWFVPYNYAFHENGQIACNFLRERVFKTSLKVEFKEMVHEGVRLPEGTSGQAINSWAVDHLRTPDEAKSDRGRNLMILEKDKANLNTRLQFYYGKELFDHDRAIEAEVVLKEVLKKEDMNPGDRILAFQYLIHSLMKNHKFQDAIQYGHLAIHLEPNRAEYYCFIAESYCALNQHIKAIPYFSAAKACMNKGNGMTHEFTFDACYNSHPRLNLSRLYFQMGSFEKCIDEVKDVEGKDARDVIMAAHKALMDCQISTSAMECDDIVITCPAQGAYPWNEKLHEEKGLGGSETAAVEMARLLRKKTKRQVRVFNNSTELVIGDSGVEYRPAPELYSYFKKWRPKLHVMWRHSEKLTNAPSMLWCHDLTVQGGERVNNYDKLMALSPFHAEYLQANLGIPKSKIWLTRNGINPELIEKTRAKKIAKVPGKVIWSNSPDRGLEHAIAIMDKVRDKVPEAELHVFYGLSNLYKYGMADKAKMLEQMIKERPWIKYKDNVTKEVLMEELASSEVWLYPATFIESFCLSALESELMSCYPVVRKIGALQNTLKSFHDKGLCDLEDMDALEYDKWASLVVNALKEKKWQKIEQAKLDPMPLSWDQVCSEWIEEFKL